MIGTLVKKDLAHFFHRPLIYFLAGLCTIIWSPIYVYSFGVFLTQMVSSVNVGHENILSFHDRVLIEFFYLVNFMLLLFSSAVTMKLVAEEKKNKTFDLLMTSPVTSWQIVASKFISGYIVLAFLVFISFLYPLTTSLLGEYDMYSMMSGYLGLLLLTGLYVGSGLVASSLTESPLIAFIIGLMLNLSLWFVGSIGYELTENESLKFLFEAMNLELQFKALVYGVIRSSSVMFFVSVSALLTFMAYRLVEAVRWR